MKINATITIDTQQAKEIIAEYLARELGREITAKDLVLSASSGSFHHYDSSPASATYTVNLKNLNKSAVTDNTRSDWDGYSR